MEKIYEAVALEMGLRGWEEQRNVVSDDMIRAVWKKKGDVGEWVFLMEYDREKRADEVLFVMELNVGKKIGSKLYNPIKVLRGAGVVPVLKTLGKSVGRLLEKTLGGGSVCQSL